MAVICMSIHIAQSLQSPVDRNYISRCNQPDQKSAVSQGVPCNNIEGGARGRHVLTDHTPMWVYQHRYDKE